MSNHKEKLFDTEVALLNLVAQLEGTSGAGISHLAMYPAYGEALCLLNRAGLMTADQLEDRRALIALYGDGDFDEPKPPPSR